MLVFLHQQERAIVGWWINTNIQIRIDYVQIMTTGNAKDFGDLANTYQSGTVSNGHGGLG